MIAVPLNPSAISRPKPEDTTRMDQANITMAKRSLTVNDEASRNTKLVEIRSKVKHHAGQQDRPKQVDRRDESKINNETKQASSTKTRQKTSDVEDHQNPEKNAAERQVGQQRSTKVNRSS